MINNEVTVVLHDGVEDTVSTDNLLIDIKFLALVKAVALLRLIHHMHRLLLHVLMLLHVLLLLHVVLLLRVHLVIVHRIRRVHVALGIILVVLLMDDMGLGNVCGLLFATHATKETQYDANDAAKARKPNHQAEKTTRT